MLEALDKELARALRLLGEDGSYIRVIHARREDAELWGLGDDGPIDSRYALAA